MIFQCAQPKVLQFHNRTIYPHSGSSQMTLQLIYGQWRFRVHQRHSNLTWLIFYCSFGGLGCETLFYLLYILYHCTLDPIFIDYQKYQRVIFQVEIWDVCLCVCAWFLNKLPMPFWMFCSKCSILQEVIERCAGFLNKLFGMFCSKCSILLEQLLRGVLDSITDYFQCAGLQVFCI